MSLVVERMRRMGLGPKGEREREAGDGTVVAVPPRTNVLQVRGGIECSAVAVKSTLNEAGKYVVWVAFSDGMLCSWMESNVASSGFRELSKFSGHKGPLLCMDAAPPFTARFPTRFQRMQGVVVTGSVDRTARVWDPEAVHNDEACVQTFWDMPGVVSAVIIVREALSPGHVFLGTNQGKVVWYRADSGRAGLQYPWYSKAGVVDAGGWVHAMVYEDQGTSEQSMRRLWVGTGAGALKIVPVKKSVRQGLSIESGTQCELVYTVTDRMDRQSRSITHLLWDDENNMIHMLSNTCEHIMVNTTTLKVSHRWRNEEGMRYTAITVDERRGHVYLMDAFGYLEVWNHKHHRMYRNRIAMSTGETTGTQDNDIVAAFVEEGEGGTLDLTVVKPRSLEVFSVRHSGKDMCIAEHYAKVLSIYLIDVFVDYLGNGNLKDIVEEGKAQQEAEAREARGEDQGEPLPEVDSFVYDDDGGDESDSSDHSRKVSRGDVRDAKPGEAQGKGVSRAEAGAGAGITMMTSSSDNLVKSWDMSFLLSRSMQHSDKVVLEEERSEITSYGLSRFSHAGTIRYAHLTGHENGTLRIWYVDREVLVSMKLHFNSVSCIAPMNLKGNGFFAATASYDGTVNLINLLLDSANKPHVTYKIKASSTELYCVVHMPDPHLNDGESGGRVFCAGTDGLIRGYTDLGVPIHKSTYEGHHADVLCLALDGHILVSGAVDGKIFLWDTSIHGDTGEPELRLRGHQAAVTGLEVVHLAHSHSSSLLSCSLDGSVTMWDLRSGVPVYFFSLPDPCTCLRYFERDMSVLVGTEAGRIFHRNLDVNAARQRLVIEAERAERKREKKTVARQISKPPIQFPADALPEDRVPDENVVPEDEDMNLESHQLRDPELSDLPYEIKLPRLRGRISSVNGLEPTWTVAVSQRKQVKHLGRVAMPPVLPVGNKNYSKVTPQQMDASQMARRLVSYKGRDSVPEEELASAHAVLEKKRNSKTFRL